MYYFIIGSCLGSFLCVLAERLPIHQPIVISRSKCNHCQRCLHFWEMIPLFSALLLKFRCHSCQQKFSTSYFWGELIYGIIFWFSFTQEKKWITLLWLTSCFLLSLVDIYYLLLEVKLFYPTHLALTILMLKSQQPIYWISIVCFLLICLIILLFFRNSIGLGDLIILAFWVPWLTPIQLAELLFLSSSSALIIYTILFFTGKRSIKIIKLPFIPFLSLGLFISYFI
ncbi:MAG TPA: prepilin peptidase [Tetragenococcus sp.]|nr:prepilin peptidase [Tetragenococcus sp.]